MRLPSWCDELRPLQEKTIHETAEAFLENDIVVLDAPTGSGKTLVAEMVRQVVGFRGLYLCSSLNLQDQFCRDFPAAALLKGRSNYTIRKGITAADCTKKKVDGKLECLWCDPVKACPYERAKAAALRADLACSNIYYFLYEANYQGALSNRPFIVVDEADTLEQMLMSFIEFRIPQRMVKELDLPQPSKKTVQSTWLTWLDDTNTTLRRAHATARRQSLLSTDVRKHRRVTQLERYLTGLVQLADKDTGIESGGWVYTGYDRGDIAFKPLEVSKFAEQYLWRHSKRWLLMSASVISSSALMRSLGIS